MYTGKKFTREQTVFMCEVVIGAAFDRIDSALPPCTPKDEYEARQAKLDEWIRAATETAGMGLAIIYTNLNSKADGMAICDADSISGLAGAVEELKKARLGNAESPFPYGVVKKLAARFVNASWPSNGAE
jgi:hypothetical protein